MIPIIPKKEDNKENLVNTNSGSIDNVSRTDKDDLGDDIKDVTLGDFNKFVKIQDTLEKSIERRNYRNQPISFGEKLGEKIEAKITDGFIDKMIGGMFNVGGSTAKPEGWLAVVKTVLDSGFAQQAGSKLPETIEAMGKTFGKQRTEQLADAVIQAVGPKKGVGTSTEDEQRKMEEYVLSLSSVNIVDIKKFMDLVNANPANAKITDTNIARDVLIEEQNRIRKESKLLSPSQQYVEENLDIDRGQRFPSSQPSGIGQRDNFMDSMMGTTPMGGGRGGGEGIGSSNQMTSEQILTLDPNSNESITAYAWSQGHGRLLQEPNGLNKIKNMLMRHQDDLMKQATGIGGSVGQQQQQPMIEDQGIDTNGSDSDNKWNEKDIGKVNKAARMNKEGEILVPPNTADSPTTNQEAQNSIMDLLQKMAVNFDNGINEMNNKLHVMEDRINKIESQESQESQEYQESQESETIVLDPSVETTDTMVLNTDDQLEEEQKEEDIESTENQPNIQLIESEDTKSQGRPKVPRSILDEPREEEKEKKEESVPIKYEKGSIGWLKEQKRLKEQKANKDKVNS